MPNDLQVQQHQVSLKDLREMGEAVAKSGLFGIKTADQALALMLIAQAEGMSPALAARDYHVIQGRPALKADAMLSRFQAAGGKVEWHDYTDQKVSGTFSHPAGGSVRIEWTFAMAQKIGLTGKDNWKHYPRAMLRARVISEGVRTCFPSCCVGVYTPEEVVDFDVAPERKPREKKVEPVIEDAQVVKEAAPQNPPSPPSSKSIEPAPTTPAAEPPAPSTPAAPATPTFGSDQAANARMIAEQLKLIRKLAIELGMKSPDDIKELVSAIVKRELTSSHDLTHQERDLVLDRLSSMAAENVGQKEVA